MRMEREVDAILISSGSCLTSPVTYLCWYSYTDVNSSAADIDAVEIENGDCDDLSMNSCLVETKHCKACTYDEGIELSHFVQYCDHDLKARYARILRHVRADGVYVSTLHDSIDSERPPISFALSKRKGGDLSFRVVFRTERFSRPLGNKGKNL